MLGTIENPRFDFLHSHSVVEDLTVGSYMARLQQSALQALKPVLDPLRGIPEGTDLAQSIEGIFAGSKGSVEVPHDAILALFGADLLSPVVVVDRTAEIEDPSGLKDIVGQLVRHNGIESTRIQGRVSAYNVRLPDVLPKHYKDLPTITLEARDTDDRIDFEHWVLSFKKYVY